MTDDMQPNVAVTPPRIAEVEPFLLQVGNESWNLFKRDPTLFIVGGALASLVTVLTLTVLAGPMMIGFIVMVHRRLHGQSARIRDLFEGSAQAVSAVIAWLLIAIASALGFALAVIPGLLVLTACCFAFHEISYRKRTAIDAIKGAFAIAKAYLLHVVLLLVAVGLLNAVGCLSLFAFLVTAPFSLVLLTVAYEKLSGQAAGSQIARVY